MAKKVRRVRRPQPAAPEPEVTAKAPAPERPRATKAAPPARAQSTAERFQDEYGYVVKDLRRVFLLAAAMFILLIVLNLVLQ